MPIAQILQYLLDLFAQWGLPKAIRTDNGEPFGVPTRDVVPMLSLWLCAWGIIPVLNRPKRPTDNAVVERAQGTTGRWARPQACADVGQLQQHLDEATYLQRERYPVTRLGHAPRLQVHARLVTNPRTLAQAGFEATRAHQFLAQAVMHRKVSSTGTISLYQQPCNVGSAHRTKIVLVTFDVQSAAWQVMELDGTILKLLPEPRLQAQALRNLSCQRTE